MDSSKKKKIAVCVALALVVAAVPIGVYAARTNKDGRMCDSWLNRLVGYPGQEEPAEIADNTESPDAGAGQEGKGPQGQPPEGFNGEMPDGQTPPEPPEGFNGEMPDGQTPPEPPEGFSGEMPNGQPPQGFPGQGGGRQGFPGGMNGQNGTVGNATEPSEIVTSSLTSNSAEALKADTANAETIVMSDENNTVKISAAGTYIVTGTCADGSITVKKGTTGVVLILKDLDLTSTSSATLSLNKGTETKVIIQGTVKLTDAENIALEDSDDFDGAAIKAKAGSSSVITGDGSLYVNGVCKNGIKVSDLDEDDIADGYTEASFIIDGTTMVVTAANDGINSGTDLTIKSGNITVSATDDGIKADYILTIGAEGTSGPTINVAESNEAIEGATINIYSGDITVNATDDGINAANKDLTDYTYSLNIMGGNIVINAGADGIDSNGNVNILGGLTTINSSAANGGEGGLDYEGCCYIVEGCLVNPFGTTMDSGMGGKMGPGGRGGENAPQNSEQGTGIPGSDSF